MDLRHHFQLWYEGNPADKLARSRDLHRRLDREGLIDTVLAGEIESLRIDCRNLADQMEAMALGRLCSGCAARPGGGCCSAVMADNTDSLQILINLMLGADIQQRQPADANCCFLGPGGCLFPAKPIFCLNYNCTHILRGADRATLTLLDQCSASVLSRQTLIESLLMDRVRILSF